MMEEVGFNVAKYFIEFQSLVMRKFESLEKKIDNLTTEVKKINK